MADEITAGSVVQLKSGGPKMTVTEVSSFSGKMMAYCDWFEGSDSKTNGFPVTSLKVVEETTPSSAGPAGKSTVWS